MGEELVRMERFEELATGMRVRLIKCGWCGREEDLFLLSRRDGTGWLSDGSSVSCRGFLIDGGCVPIPGSPPRIGEVTVSSGRIFRFASDLGIADAIAAEENPYTDRTVVGTGGREETRILTRERGR